MYQFVLCDVILHGYSKLCDIILHRHTISYHIILYQEGVSESMLLYVLCVISYVYFICWKGCRNPGVPSEEAASNRGQPREVFLIGWSNNHFNNLHSNEPLETNQTLEIGIGQELFI